MSKCNICGAPIFSDEPVTDQPCLDCIMEPLPNLIDKAITMLLRADGDRDHMNHSDITCEQSMAIVEILRMSKSASHRAPFVECEYPNCSCPKHGRCGNVTP
jgi:hypothetical protein